MPERRGDLVDASGVVARVVRPGDDGYVWPRPAPSGSAALFCQASATLHVHAPQWPQLGLALDVPLEVWLQTHTFPLEARYSDLDFARASYSGLVDELLSLGTTTAMYFASIHTEATKLLADICLEKVSAPDRQGGHGQSRSVPAVLSRDHRCVA